MNCRRFGFIISVFFRQLSLPLLVCSTLWFSNVLLCGAATAQTGNKTDSRAIALGLISEINQSAIEEHFRD